MTGQRQIDLDYVIGHCEQEADQHKMGAAYEAQTAFSSVKDQKKRDEHLAKAQMADQLAEHFRNHAAAQHAINPEVEELARTIDPDAFASHDALISRVVAEGHDQDYASRVARASYGDRIDAAYEEAAASIQTEINNPDDSLDYEKGVEEVAKWHEQRALEAERLEQLETVPARKHKYGQRAKRHRLYAKQIRSDFSDKREEAALKRAKERDQEEPRLPLPRPELTTRAQGPGRSTPQKDSDDIPLEVQAAFRKKSEVFDDEGWT